MTTPSLPGIVALAALAAASALRPAASADTVLRAPNVVVISPSLVTSGQPSPAELATLGTQGFAAVVSLAPSSAPDAVRDEPAIVRGQGLDFVHIPIDFTHPAEADVRLFFEALRRLHDRKVLVHCQVNMRASAMTFLYRTIVERVDPERAYEAVAAVWSPQGPWKAFIVAHLRQAGIAFVPY